MDFNSSWALYLRALSQLTANSAPENKANLCLVIAADRLKKEKRTVISAPSARGKGNCVALICRLFRPNSELVFGPSRKFSEKIDRIVFAWDTKF